MVTITTLSTKHYQDWQGLYREAFPAYERFAWSKLERLANEQNIQLLSFLDEQTGHFIGLAALVEFTNGGAYLIYFAIVKEGRGRGLGGQALAALKKRYPAGLILECERRDSTAQNANQRERRYAFYLQQGFVDTHYLVHNQGADFHLLRSSHTVTLRDYLQATQHIQMPTQVVTQPD